MDEVHAWGKDLQALQTIKGQRYRTLTEVYKIDETNKLEDWIEKIAIENKVMEELQEYIHKLKD